MEHFGRKCEGRFPQSTRIDGDFPLKTIDVTRISPVFCKISQIFWGEM